ncbi:MAG: pyridoxal kinase, partial [Pseudomonas aeruginosa]|nr:pyridoxal kinase [Pseudomonas aeruginosa]
MPRTPHLLAIQSHVVFGHAGNAAAVFPMQRIGINVWPLNTVQFSNHTQYGQWTGQVLPPEQIPALVDGIAGIGELGNCDAVLSGYLGSAAQGRAILDVVARIKQANPRALYLCDPVMGHPEKGCIVAPEVSDFLLEEAAALTGTAQLDFSRRAVLVLCADNGVVAQGVSQTDQSVTRAVAENLAARRTSVCQMAKTARCEVVPVDMGMAGDSVPGVVNCRFAAGTQDFTQGPAMTRA